MTCYHPLAAFQDANGYVHFGRERRGLPAARTFDIPCGKCIGCKLHKAKEYGIRCMHEAKLYDENSFVTLTYDNENLPPDGGLDYTHFQKFLKRLRKSVSPKLVRFYMSGEYGETTFRPHYHAILFNHGFRDKLYFKTANGFKLYTSKTLNELWGLGNNNLIGEVTLESAAYVAGYCTKVITGDQAEHYYTTYNHETGEIHRIIPPFAKMSLKPGIGAPWFVKFHKDVYPADEVMTNGKKARPPRYYDTLLKRIDEDQATYIAHKRYKQHLQRQKGEQSPERLAVKEEIQYHRLAQYSRKPL